MQCAGQAAPSAAAANVHLLTAGSACAAAGKEADEGSISSVRDPWFQMVHRLLDSSLTSGGSLRGSLFWQV